MVSGVISVSVSQMVGSMLLAAVWMWALVLGAALSRSPKVA